MDVATDTPLGEILSTLVAPGCVQMRRESDQAPFLPVHGRGDSHHRPRPLLRARERGEGLEPGATHCMMLS